MARRVKTPRDEAATGDEMASGAGGGDGEATHGAPGAPPALAKKRPDPSARTRPPKLGAITEGGDDDSDGKEEGSDTDGASPAEVRINMRGSAETKSSDESKAAAGIVTQPKGSPQVGGTGTARSLGVLFARPPGGSPHRSRFISSLWGRRRVTPRQVHPARCTVARQVAQEVKAHA